MSKRLNKANIMFIDNSLKDPKVVLNKLNNQTLGIVYSYDIERQIISKLLQSRQTTIKRIGFYFKEGVQTFLEHDSYFSNVNIDFISQIIKKYNVQHIDIFSSGILKHKIWLNFCEKLQTKHLSLQIHSHIDQKDQMYLYEKNKEDYKQINQEELKKQYFLPKFTDYIDDLYYEKVNEELEKIHEDKQELLEELFKFSERLSIEDNNKNICKREFEIDELNYSVECCGSETSDVKDLFHSESYYAGITKTSHANINTPNGDIRGPYSQSFYNPHYVGGLASKNKKIFYISVDINGNSYNGEYTAISFPVYIQLNKFCIDYVKESHSLKKLSILGSNNLGETYELVGQYDNEKGATKELYITNSKLYKMFRIVYESKNKQGQWL